MGDETKKMLGPSRRQKEAGKGEEEREMGSQRESEIEKRKVEVVGSVGKINAGSGKRIEASRIYGVGKNRGLI